MKREEVISYLREIAPKYATCEYCNQVMHPVDRLPFESAQLYPTGYCRDCNAAEGQLHHAGCCIEECSKCHGLTLSCDCADA